jgi:small GTP-binding protein domain
MKDQSQEKSVPLRSPVIVVLGHVDHGKTTLLDAIRKTNQAQRELGGITQSVGASVAITPQGKKITFIDTPGHAAFSKMRSRGAKIADIAILVVASDDGVMPQTKEALEYIYAEKIPFIVAATKIDLPSASRELVKSGLSKLGVIFEDSGGDTPYIEISAKKGTGIDNLLEVVSLVSDLNGIQGDEGSPLEAYVLETGKGNKGQTVSVVVKDGNIKVGDKLITENKSAKVRGIFDDLGHSVQSILPGQPGLLLGFSDLPDVGARIWRENDVNAITKTETQKALIGSSIEGQMPILIKAQSTGSLEALLAQIPPKFFIVSSGIGDINDSDVFLAKSANAIIFAFQIRVQSSVRKLADTEGIKIEEYGIIYELIDRLTELSASTDIIVLAETLIIKTFPFDQKRVAGCKVIKGVFSRKDDLLLKRGAEKLGKIKVISMQKGKVEIETAKQGEEFGIIFVPQLEFREGDMIISTGK